MSNEYFSEAPGLSSPSGGGGKTNYTSSDDLDFEQRLQAIRKYAAPPFQFSRLN